MQTGCLNCVTSAKSLGFIGYSLVAMDSCLFIQCVCVAGPMLFSQVLGKWLLNLYLSKHHLLHTFTLVHTHTHPSYTPTPHTLHTRTLYTPTPHTLHTHTHTHLTHTPPYTHTHTHLTHIHPSHTYTPPTHPSYTHHTQVSVIKAKLADELGMPTGKQKLQIGVSQYYITCTWEIIRHNQSCA